MSQTTAVDVEAPISGTTSTWPVDQIRNFASIGTGAKDTQDRSQAGRYPFFVRSQKIERIDSWSFDGEAVLTAGDGVGTGKVFHYINGRFDYHQRVYRISSFRSDVSGKYFFYQFSRNFLARIESLTAKSSVDSVRMETIAGMEIPLPSRVEQDRIVDAIDDADALIVLLERLIAKKHSVKQGLMQQLLTGKTRLPGFTETWRTIRLGDHVTYVKTVALSRAQLDNSSPLRYLHYGDIHTNNKVRLSAETADMPRVPAVLSASAGRLMPGDVVFADASEDPAGVGKSVEITSVPPEGVVPGLHTIAARFNKSVIADGFKAYLQFIPEFRNSLLRLAAGTKVLATTRTYISSVTLQLPDVAEQSAIAQVLRDADDEIDALNLRLAKAMSVKQGMMQELLTGRTRLRAKEHSA